MPRELYILELGNRTVMGYIESDDLIGEQEETLELVDMEYVELEYPAVVTMQMVPVQGNIATPSNQPEMGIGLMVLPYYVPRLNVLVSNIMGYTKIPDKSPLIKEMKTVVSHYLGGEKDERQFPHIVK